MTILFVVYGCATWSPTLREDPRLKKMFENRKLRKVLGPNRKGDRRLEKTA